MKTTISEKNYNLALTLYEKVSNNFYLIENDEAEDTNFLIDQTFVYLKKLEQAINKIDLNEIADIYDENELSIISDNVETFKEAVYTINSILNAMLVYDKLYPVMYKYVKYVEWNLIASNEDEAAVKIANYLSDKEEYKSFVINIVKGTLKQKDFDMLFKIIVNRIGTSKAKPINNTVQIPPEMWNETNTAWHKSNEYNVEYSKHISSETESISIDF